MTEPRRPRRASGPLLVALGIGLSRLAGLGRETVASRLLGNTAAGDAFAVAMRIPNMLQNLLGEGVLSASFVPVYSRLLDEATDEGGDAEDPGRVAGAVAAALMTVVGLAVARARRIQRFLTQPFFVAEQFTGRGGRYVPVAETVRGFTEILEGKHDELPENAFYMVGTIDEAVENAREMAEED